MGNIRVRARLARALSALGATALLATDIVSTSTAVLRAVPAETPVPYEEVVDAPSTDDAVGRTAIAVTSGAVLLAVAGGLVVEVRRRRLESSARATIVDR